MWRQEFTEILAHVPVALFYTDAEGALVFCNDAAATLLGERPTLGANWWDGWRLFDLSGNEASLDHTALYVALKSHREETTEGMAVRRDGSRLLYEAIATPMLRDGVITGVVLAVSDITVKKTALAREDVLRNEFEHRVKNLLATVQAVMSAARRSATSLDEFEASCMARVTALANTQVLISQSKDRPIPLPALLEAGLGAFADRNSGRIFSSGPNVRIPPRLAMPLGLSFFELATNAAKHGALARLEGTIRIEWQLDGSRLELLWKEMNVPGTRPPLRTGFGSRLLTRVLPIEGRGEVTLDFTPDGLHARILVNLEPSNDDSLANKG